MLPAKEEEDGSYTELTKVQSIRHTKPKLPRYYRYAHYSDITNLLAAKNHNWNGVEENIPLTATTSIPIEDSRTQSVK